MKKLLLLLFAFFLVPLVSAQMANVTGTIQSVAGVPAGPSSYVEFTLVNCGQTQPTVNGVAVMLNAPVDFYPNASGNLVTSTGTPAQLYGNDVITCGTLGFTSRYSVQQFPNGQPAGVTKYYFVSSALGFNLNTAISIAVLPPLVYPNPTTCPTGSYIVGLNNDLSPQCTNLPGAASNAVVTNPAGTQVVNQPSGSPISLGGSAGHTNIDNSGHLTSPLGTLKLPRVDVTHPDFGAGCPNPADFKGNLDSTCAIQAAIAYAFTQPVAHGATPAIYFPGGTYKISGELRVSSPISFYGDAMDQSTLWQTGTTNLITLAGAVGNPLCGANGGCGIDVANLTLEGSGTASTGTLLECDNATNLRLDNVKMINHGGRALVINNCERGSSFNLNIQFVRWPLVMSGASNEFHFYHSTLFGGAVFNPGNTGGIFCYNINCVGGNFPAANSAPLALVSWAASNNQNIGDFIADTDAAGGANFRLSAGGSVVSNLWVPCQTGATKPAFSTLATGQTIADGTCTWTDVRRETILHPDYHAMAIVNGVDVGFFGGSLKTTQYQSGFNLMSGGGEGVLLAQNYIEGFNGESPNPAIEIDGGLDEFPLNLSTPLSSTTLVIPITDGTWFPKYYSNPADPNTFGTSSFENYIIYPPDANANSTAASICSAGGVTVLQNQSEVIRVNGVAGDNNVYINDTGGVSGRFASGSTAPSGTQWCAGSYIRRQTSGLFSGVKLLGDHINSSNLSASGYTSACGDLQFNNMCGDILMGPAFNGKDIPYPVTSGVGLTTSAFKAFIKLDGTSLFRGSDESVGQGYLKTPFFAQVFLQDPEDPASIQAQNQTSFTTLQSYLNGITTMQAIYTPSSAPAYHYSDAAGRAVETDIGYASNPTEMSVGGNQVGILDQFLNEKCDGDFPATGTLSNMLFCQHSAGGNFFWTWQISNTTPNTTLGTLLQLNATGVGSSGLSGTFSGILGAQIPLKNAANTWASGVTQTFAGPVSATGTVTLPGATTTIGGATPVVTGTPTVGATACIKSAGPPLVMGWCSAVNATTGTCTCN